ncbi:MAG: SDR family oxidoreductase [Candidatus Heimdallarchaeota archaeon]|nr:SDR family oxidoreductase [Candidatus Heimdallarchaeota archaeon]
MKRTNNGTILITAPGGGIGKEITRKLLEDDFKVIGLGGKGSQNFVNELKGKGHNIDFINCDYYTKDSMLDAISQAKKLTEKINGFIHLAGGSLISKPIDEISFDEYQSVMSLNLDSAFLLGRETYKWMKKTGGGNIVLFGSTTGFRPSLKKLPYGVAKAGIHAMTGFFAKEGSEYNIITNTIAPGYVLTERHVQDIEKKAEKTGQSYDSLLEKINSKNPLKQTLLPKDIYQLVKLLITTKHIQGQIIKIDSGQILS